MAESFVTWEIADVLVGEPIPGPLYIYIDFRFITYRSEGDVVDRMTFDRLLFKKVKSLFVLEKDRAVFQKWVDDWRSQVDKDKQKIAAELATPASVALEKARAETHRKVMDIFQSQHPDKIVSQAITVSKKLVSEVMKSPYAVKSLAQLQTFSQGTVDHSVNVSILSTYLAMQMGYSHQVILQHVGIGGLLHDIGKARVRIEDSDGPEVIEVKMKEHPLIGLRMLESQQRVPNEVKMIVAQHHENNDGTGYPKGLRAGNIYDLARIVSIANAFDDLVGNGHGSLLDRQKAALTEMDQSLFKKFDPQKLEKALKILRLGV